MLFSLLQTSQVFAGGRPFSCWAVGVPEARSSVVRRCWGVSGVLCVPCAWLSQGNGSLYDGCFKYFKLSPLFPSLLYGNAVILY